jgi:cytochrome P450
MTHDKAIYPNPELFDPERFAGPQPQPDPREIVFGFGRRSCPGNHQAEWSVYIQMVYCLALFRITKARDKSGNEVPIGTKFSTAVVR